ncbi:MAG: Diguanylate cyclase DosC [Stenotrophomonas maltophilia]|nr:MAG: Diguanylate cyclase DosC [Stenotrophomonas maltophilia]
MPAENDVDPLPLDDASQPLVAAWLHTLQHNCPAATALLHAVAVDAPPVLAQRFYEVLLVDTRARRFLSHDQVKQRLQPAMQRRLVQLLTTTAPGVEATVAAQRVIGDVHARVGIPVDLVTRGTRVLKHDLYARLQAGAPDAATAFDAIRTASALVDIAMEGMTLAYTHARDRSSRTDAAYRLFSLVQNVSTERERQRALLLDWENTLLYTLAGHASGDGASLAASEFGLWFTHKGIPSFGESSETAKVDTLMKAIDSGLQQAAGDDPAQRLAALPAIREQLAAIRTLMTLLFERIGELDAGSDTLTNLLNRRFLPTVLRREIELATRNQTPFALLMLDLDHFKAINDGHGHDVGDRALQHVAGLLGQLTRGSDYLFRYGGEEFVVVLVAASESQAAVIAESLRRQIAQSPLQLANGTVLPLSASIGVAGHDGLPDYERLMRRADAAMYAAKRQGRDRVVVAADGLPEAPGRRSARAL